MLVNVFLSFITGSKRRHPNNDDDDEEDGKPREELWSLRDVIFLYPPLSSAPLGRVIKLDGLYAAVLFPSLNKEGSNKRDIPKGNDPSPSLGGGEAEENNSLLSQCRLLRRDDLVVRRHLLLAYI